MTPGQRSTLMIGLAIGLASVALGLPPVLRQADDLATSGAAASALPPASPARATAAPSLPTVPVTVPVARPTPVLERPEPPRPSAPRTVSALESPPVASVALPTPAAPASVTASGWARSPGVTDVFAAELEDDELPVGATLGREDYRSFLRVAGDLATLRLDVVGDHPATRSAATAVVSACALTDGGWRPGGGQAMADAPAFDPASCVDGALHDDGAVMSFDLSNLDRTNGVALRAGDGGLSFAVVLRPATWST